MNVQPVVGELPVALQAFLSSSLHLHIHMMKHISDYSDQKRGKYVYDRAESIFFFHGSIILALNSEGYTFKVQSWRKEQTQIVLPSN